MGVRFRNDESEGFVGRSVLGADEDGGTWDKSL